MRSRNNTTHLHTLAKRNLFREAGLVIYEIVHLLSVSAGSSFFTLFSRHFIKARQGKAEFAELRVSSNSGSEMRYAVFAFKLY